MIVSSDLHNTIVLTWVLTSVFVWPMVGIFIPGNNLATGFMKFLHPIAYMLSVVSIATFAYVAPFILFAVLRADYSNAIIAGAAVGMTIWTAVHAAGALFVFFRSLRVWRNPKRA